MHLMDIIDIMKISVSEGTQSVDFGGRLSRCSLAKQFVPTQKNIGYANQLLG